MDGWDGQPLLLPPLLSKPDSTFPKQMLTFSPLYTCPRCTILPILNERVEVVIRTGPTGTRMHVNLASP